MKRTGDGTLVRAASAIVPRGVSQIESGTSLLLGKGAKRLRFGHSDKTLDGAGLAVEDLEHDVLPRDL